MQITLNGKRTEEYGYALPVSSLLDQLGLTGQPVLVELDGIALHPREHAETTITEGAVVEIIRIAAGG